MDYTSFETAFKNWAIFLTIAAGFWIGKNENKTIQFGNRHQCIASRGI
mgnify:CR=1 FL=1